MQVWCLWFLGDNCLLLGSGWPSRIWPLSWRVRTGPPRLFIGPWVSTCRRIPDPSPNPPDLGGRNIERNSGRVTEAGAAYKRNRPLIPIYTFISHHLNLIMCHDTFPAGSVIQVWIMSFLTELTCVLLSSPFFHYYVLFNLTAKKQGVAMINHFRRCHFTICTPIEPNYTWNFQNQINKIINSKVTQT